MSPRKLTLLFALLLTALILPAQTDSTLTGTKLPKYSVSDIYILSLMPDNSAAGCFLQRSFLSAEFDNRFLVKEMMTKRVGAVFRKGQSGFTVECQHFGYSRFGELTAKVGYGRRFGQHLAFGVRFHYLMTHSAESRCVHSVTFDLSCYATLGRNIGLGFAVLNPARLKYGITGKNSLPIRLQFDVNYKVGKQILLFAQVEKEIRSAFRIEAGAAYQVKVLHLTVSAGFPAPYGTVRVHVACGRWLIGVSGQYHLKAGFIPQANVYCTF